MYKILIIEDDLTMAQAIQKEMKMWGNDAQYVQDFKNVLETFAEFDPHLVLMDITLLCHFTTGTTGAARLGKYRTYR